MVDEADDKAARRRDPKESRELIESLYAKASSRRSALEFFANAIEVAHRANPDVWRTSLRSHAVHLTMGRLWACGLYPERVWVAVIPSAMPAGSDEVIRGAGGEVAVDETFRLIPEASIYTVPATALTDLQGRLADGLRAFLTSAAKKSKRAHRSDQHSAGVLRYVEAELGRTLPRPTHAPSDEGVPDLSPRRETTKAIAVVEPRVQFTERRYDVDGLLKYIELGDIALPDIQRPFVWTSTKVRDLFDSMYRGFPVGSLMLWATAEPSNARPIGLDEKQRVASLLVVDGQQRLTSMYAVLRGKPVIDDDFRETQIEIAFRPRDASFEVTDAAIRKDPEFIPNISELWASNKPSRRFINDYLDRLRARRDLTTDDEDAISHNIDRLFDLTKYPFSALEVAKDVKEEAVADIFVRINNGGTKLGQSAFILTLLSVFSPQTRKVLEDFAREASTPPSSHAPSPYNHLIRPSPDQLLRVAIAIGFHRARLSAVYQLLRGKDVETGVVSAEKRAEQFARLDQATARALDLRHWHAFLSCIVGAGFRSGDLVSSEAALLNAYAFYLLGRLQCSVDGRQLDRLIARFFFAVAVTARYSGSSETVMEDDLSDVRDVHDAGEFVAALEDTIEGMLTHDFWDITLPRDLETSLSTAPAARAYVAAQIKLGAPVLFSDRRIADLYDPSIRPQRKSIEVHHLFPKNHLKEKLHITETKQVNQAANLAYLEWPDNLAVSDDSPADYVPRLREHFSTETFDAMMRFHALPPGWESMPYDTFLLQRRKLMAALIRRGFNALADGDTATADAPKFAAADEKRAWTLIEELELQLRRLVRAKAEAKWGPATDARIRKLLSEKEQTDLDSHKAKHLAAYPLSPGHSEADILDYFYLGQLVSVLLSNDLWGEVKPLFKEKDLLQRRIGAISKVRNDRAHFRPVPEKELQRCVLECDDLLTLLRRPVAVS